MWWMSRLRLMKQTASKSCGSEANIFVSLATGQQGDQTVILSFSSVSALCRHLKATFAIIKPANY